MKSHKLFVVSLLFWMLGLSVYAQQVSVNSADYSRNLSPGVLASAFGVNLALGEQGAASFPLPTEMGGTRVLVGGKAATLLYVSPYQINYQIPPDTAAGVQEVVVQRNDGTSFKETITVNQSSFGAFSFDSTGTGTGLDNTKSRLDLLYGDRHGFALQTTKTGTTSAGFSFSGKQFD